MHDRKPRSIFISHRNGETDADVLSAQLLEALEGAGFNVWLDSAALHPGVEWCEKVFQWIERSHAAVVLLSPGALDEESIWVPFESIMLAARRARDPNFTVIPVLLGGVTSTMLRNHVRFRDSRLHDLQAIQHGGALATVQAILGALARVVEGDYAPVAGPVNREARQRLVDLSLLAMSDAGNVTDMVAVPPGTDGLAKLYIERTVESELVDWIARPAAQAARAVIIVGSAGHGKTSLLWNTFRRFGAGCTHLPFFIKSTWLYQSPGKEPLLSAAALEQALIGGGEGRKLVLIDTVDLLMHDETNRTNLLTLIWALVKLGVQLVMSTRPAENKLLTWDSRLGGRVDLYLGSYDRDEFPRAIASYAAHYYGLAQHERAEDESARLQQTVANGRPLGEICLNPLSLRMLFSLYAPHQISDEINVFRLYTDFWRIRIESDTRAGDGLATGGRNLGKAACALALTMLLEGTPELQSMQLPHLCRQADVLQADFDALLARGILIGGANRSIAFFHQTFFEHAAARVLLAQIGCEAIALLAERIGDTFSDQFLMPVFEQLLLLSLEHFGLTPRMAQAQMRVLLANEHLPGWSSGLYVYCHTHCSDGVSNHAVEAMLRSGSETQCRRFLDLLPNLPATRIDDACLALTGLMQAPTWRVREHAVKLIAWIASRDWPKAQVLLDNEQLIAVYLRTVPPKYAIDKLLYPILRIALPHNLAWTSAMLDQFAAHPQCEVGRLADFVTEGLAANRPAAFLFALAERIPAFAERMSTARPHVMAKALESEWRKQGADVAPILASLAEASNWHQRAILHGLARYCVTLGPAAIRTVLTHFPYQQPQELQWMWLASLIHPMLAESGDASRGPVLAWLSPHLQWHMGGGDMATAEQLPLAMALSPWRLGLLPFSDLTPVLAAEPAMYATWWLDEARLGVALLNGLQGQAQGAAAAFDLACLDPERHGRILDMVRGAMLHQQWQCSVVILDAAARMALSTRDISLPTILLEKKLVASAAQFSPWCDALVALARESVQSVVPKDRINGWSFRRHAILGKVEKADARLLADLFDAIAAERDAMVRNALFSLLPVASYDDLAERKSALDILLHYSQSKATETRRVILSAAVRIFAELGTDKPDWIDKIMDLVLQPGADEYQVHHFGYLMESLLNQELVELASASFQRFMRDPVVNKLGKTPKAKLAHHLSKPLSMLVQRQSLAQRTALMGLVYETDQHLGRLIVNVLCRTSVMALAPFLEQHLLDRRLHGDLKKLINDYLAYHVRAASNAPWQALELMLKI